ncbi:MurR/RpiR family transcriptional regulator [Companilactobacillus formosensis]|uniref:MurR/RpiR family transcriptional regulator n=1 Tax=Companilactobacillus formosensis TaxID=1617889 RepID=UPI000E649EC1|nr:MurR/RpiR family transcriptional regulator [Companilactobacillus formosensis]
MKLEEIIDKHYNEFSVTEKGMCQYILKNHNKIASMGILDFARESLASKSSVIRFCQKIGFTGYTEMKNFIKWDDGNSKKRDSYSFFDQVKSDTEMLLSSLDYSKWIPIYESIYNSKRVYMVATGVTQQNQALELQRLLMLSGKDSGLLPGNKESSEFQRMAESLDSNDFLIILSLSGENKSLEDVIREIEKRESKLLSITNYHSNWLSQNCDFNLYSRSSRSPDTEDWWLKTTSTFFVLIEAFVFGYNDYLKTKK